MKNCPKKKCLISVVAVFALMFFYDKLLHGCPWMMDMYHQTAALWRTPEAMQEVFPWFFVRYGLLAMAITCLYKKVSSAPVCDGKVDNTGSGCCMKRGTCVHKRGICFGMKIGTILGVVQASSYIWMPIPGSLAIAWFAGGLVQGVLVGLLLSFICGQSKECAAK